jgi:hypothetical protein
VYTARVVCRDCTNPSISWRPHRNQHPAGSGWSKHFVALLANGTLVRQVRWIAGQEFFQFKRRHAMALQMGTFAASQSNSTALATDTSMRVAYIRCQPCVLRRIDRTAVERRILGIPSCLLCAAAHAAEPLFEEAKQEIERQFEIRRVFKIPESN